MSAKAKAIQAAVAEKLEKKEKERLKEEEARKKAKAKKVAAANLSCPCSAAACRISVEIDWSSGLICGYDHADTPFSAAGIRKSTVSRSRSSSIRTTSTPAGATSRRRSKALSRTATRGFLDFGGEATAGRIPSVPLLPNDHS